MKHQPCPPCPTLPAISGQGGTTHLAPIPVGGQVGAGSSDAEIFTTPGQGKKTGQGPTPVPLFELDRITMRRRAARKTTCTLCGTPTWTGPDDTPAGPQTKTVTLDRTPLTRLGMYQAATTGRRIYTLRHSKVGREIDWLGEIAQPDPDRDHLLAAHDCHAPPLDTRDEPDLATRLNGPPPF